ncbi:methionyl-tRNA formyltransferase [Candidatus Microgenomates bacterium]|nr:methionyl-tRNA formyltransferase [Candidatus Microgenomates bacterium]
MNPNSPRALPAQAGQQPKSPPLVFFSTPDYVLPVLEQLKNAGYEIAAIVSQPPKPVGRKQILTPTPTAVWASQNNIPNLDASPKTLIEPLQKIGATIAILASYGRIIPQAIIDVFPQGILNIHPSLLPKFRGALPVEGALVAGESETGVTIIKLDAEMDHGPIVSQITEKINKDDTKITLRKRLFEKGAAELIKVLPDYLAGKIALQEQDHTQATYTTLMKKEYGFIPPQYLEAAFKGETLEEKWPIPFIKDFSLVPSAYSLHNFIRAINPWPGAYTEVILPINTNTTNKQSLALRANYQSTKKRLKILKSHLENLVAQEPNAPTVHLVPDLVQLEGKNPVSWQQFKQGYPNFTF